MGDPPSAAGGVHDTVAVVSPATAITSVGAPGALVSIGGAVGTTMFVGAEGGPVPMALVAATVKVCAMSLVRPVTVHDTSTAVAQVAPPGDAVTVYVVMVDPPSAAGGVHVTVAAVLPAMASAPVGASGAVATTGADAADAAPVPTPLVAVTVNVWVLSSERPVIVQDRAPAVSQVASPGEAVAV